MEETKILDEETWKEEPEIKRSYIQAIKQFGRLGKEIKISPKAHTCINHPGYKIQYYVDTVHVAIGIGNDCTADLIMSVEAWQALNNGEKIDITTTKEFNEKCL